MAGTSARIAFVVTEDWFFASHFLPLAEAARELRLDVDVITRVRAHRGTIEQTGARVIPLEAERRSLNPLAAAYAAGRTAAILRDTRPDIVHCIALRSILLGGAAAAMAGLSRRVYAPTGLGLLGASEGGFARIGLAGLRFALAGPLASPGTRYLFENRDDPRRLGLDPEDASRITVVGGAGIDPHELWPAPFPDPVPLRVAIVSRMLWSKGIDLAVAAVRAARAEGASIELSLFGQPDRSNPRAISEGQLRAWSAEPGIKWHGPTSDVSAVWRDHHVACVPSRGGEGLPRTLLEAASCGRPIVAADVPGCNAFVRDEREGLLVRPGDPDGWRVALTRLAADPVLAPRMGAAARARIFDGFTERDVMDAVKSLWSEMLATPT